MWNAVRNILRNADIGDIGALGGREPSLNDATSNADETNAALLAVSYTHLWLTACPYVLPLLQTEQTLDTDIHLLKLL